MVKKISIFLIAITLLLTIIPIKSHALSMKDEIIDEDKYDPGTITSSDIGSITKIVNPILGVIYYLGTFISVGAIMLIGIKYMMGSLEEKAQYKETLGPYFIGAVLLFGGINILRIIYTIVEKTL